MRRRGSGLLKKDLSTEQRVKSLRPSLLSVITGRGGESLIMVIIAMGIAGILSLGIASALQGQGLPVAGVSSSPVI